MRRIRSDGARNFFPPSVYPPSSFPLHNRTQQAEEKSINQMEGGTCTRLNIHALHSAHTAAAAAAVIPSATALSTSTFIGSGRERVCSTTMRAEFVFVGHNFRTDVCGFFVMDG